MEFCLFKSGMGIRRFFQNKNLLNCYNHYKKNLDNIRRFSTLK